MTEHRIGIIMNGVTGRMGSNQHLNRSIVAIIQQGGIKINSTEIIVPEPILVGRNPEKLAKIAAAASISNWTTDLDSALGDSKYQIYFDAQSTNLRVEALKKAIQAGKHVYCEKPLATGTEDAYAIYRLVKTAGLKNGIVQDKLWLPGVIKMKRLLDSGFFGQILSIRGEFGYWVFEGDRVAPQRPSWNYRQEDGGGIILDMFPHWHYLLENLFAPIQALCCLGATHIRQRWDENGQPYTCTADDSAYSTIKLESGIIAHFNSSWAVRVRRDDLFTLQVDGTQGSAVAGLRQCWCQSYADTPRPIWNPDVDSPLDYFDSWKPVYPQETFENAFKIQWELFLKHVIKNEPFPWTLLQGARGVQLAEMANQSWQERKWLDIPILQP